MTVSYTHLGRYRRAGSRIGMCTDTNPHNMLEEMRHVGYVARMMAENPRTLTTTDIFEAATTAGAAALGRDDIGRLEAGCKADLVMVDLEHPMMQPRRDPVRSMVYAAAELSLIHI